MKIGAAQFASESGNVDANVEIHLDWITRGRSEKLDLLVMPEMSLTGHYGSDNLLSAAMTSSDPRLLQLAEEAGDMTVVVGFVEEGLAAQFYNTAVMLKAGKVVHLHRKVNLANYGKLEEGKHYATGRFVDTYSLDKDWRAGLLICADLWNPALTHLAFLHGATLMITPVSSALEAVGPAFNNPDGWARAMRFYAMIYGAPCIMVNRSGVEKDLTFWGGSRIVDPFGAEIAVAGSDEEMITAELDFDQVRKARYQLPTVRDSNIALVHLETSRLIDKLGVPDFIGGHRE
jgi:predicted amidohydrolase